MDTTSTPIRMVSANKKERNPQRFSSLFMEVAKIARHYLHADGSVISISLSCDAVTDRHSYRFSVRTVVLHCKQYN